MWEITKSFEFDFGHRVWSQSLKEEYALDTSCKCKYLHGHRGKILVTLEGRELEDGMVTDFKHLNIFKKFINDVVDHKFLWDMNDPLLSKECEGVNFIPVTSFESFLLKDSVSYKIIDIKEYYSSTLKEKYEGFVFLPFVPTAENFARWYYNLLQCFLLTLISSSRVRVKSVTFYETPSSSAVYSE